MVHSFPWKAYWCSTGQGIHSSYGTHKFIFSPLSLFWKNKRRLMRSLVCLCMCLSVYPVSVKLSV
jgi:hypothetical protein